MEDEKKKQAEAEAAARKAARDAANAEELAALKSAQDTETAGLQDYNKAQYDNIGQIIGDIQSKIDVAKVKDETAQRRENAYRYISGLGDTLSSLANLVGVGQLGAANQKQTYNSNAVVQKAEDARKARKIEIDDLSKRLDELNARQRELKAAGSLKEVELRAKNAKDQIALQSKQNALAREEERIAREEKRKQEEIDYRKERDAKQDALTDRKLAIEQKQFAQSIALRTRELEATLADKAASKTYPMTIKGQKYEIPVRELNDAQVGNIFSKLPDEVQNAVKGEAYTEKIINDDGFEETQTKYKAPTLSQKIAAIAEYAEKTGDASIIAEVANLAGVAPAASEVVTAPSSAYVGQSSGTDWSIYANGASPATAEPTEEKPFYMNATQEARAKRKEERRNSFKAAKAAQRDSLSTNNFNK